MPVTQNPQVLYGSQNYILKGNLPRIPNSGAYAGFLKGGAQL